MKKDAEKSTLGGFYEVSRGAIETVAGHGRAALLLTYLALKRHQQKFNLNVINAGAPCVQNTLGISRRRADKLIDELREVAWGPGFADAAVVDWAQWNERCTEGEEIEPGPYQANKVLPPLGDEYIYLPNQLNQRSKIHALSPLGQLYHLSEGKQVAYDATRLLLGIYTHLDMPTFGGVDPTTALHIPWRHDGTADQIEDLNLGWLGEADGLHFYAVDFRRDDNSFWWEACSSGQWSFIESVTGETRGTDAPRFFDAWHALNRLGLVYHVPMVFATDPFADPDPELLYPLWTFNPAERERLNDRGHHEGGLALDCLKAAKRKAVSYVLDEYHDIALAHQIPEGEALGYFIAAARNPDARVVGIVRPRFVPNTKDSQTGWGRLRDQATMWHEIICET